jgi:hypothetical protein
MEEVKVLDGQSRAMKTLVMLAAVVLFALSLNSCKAGDNNRDKEDKNGAGSKVADDRGTVAPIPPSNSIVTVTPIPMTLEEKARRMKKSADWVWSVFVDMNGFLMASLCENLEKADRGNEHGYADSKYDVKYAQEYVDYTKEIFERMMEMKTRMKILVDETEVLARMKVTQTEDAAPYLAAIENDRAIVEKTSNDVNKLVNRIQVRVEAVTAKLAQKKSELEPQRLGATRLPRR